MLTAIDLFAGGGGLTVGLKRAGFKVVTAIEAEAHACATYATNHPDVDLIRRDIKDVSARDSRTPLTKVPIDLVAGCPPCQGFTSLTYKYRGEDKRNLLMFEMMRFVQDLKPRAIMMENVPGLIRRGAPLFKEFTRKLKNWGYRLEYGILNAADYGVPQWRRRLVLLGGLGFPISLPSPTHSKNGENGLEPWRTVKDAISHMEEPVTLQDARNTGSPQERNWHVTRSLSAKNIKRIKVAKPGLTWRCIPEQLRPKCHKGSYEGFTNVYGRMKWEAPSPTITGGCTTFSKGRFGHPTRNRTISVREAALLQTFPEQYHLVTPYMERACNIVGNALPCDFSEAVSRQCMIAFENQCPPSKVSSQKRSRIS